MHCRTVQDSSVVVMTYCPMIDTCIGYLSNINITFQNNPTFFLIKSFFHFGNTSYDFSSMPNTIRNIEVLRYTSLFFKSTPSGGSDFSTSYGNVTFVRPNLALISATVYPPVPLFSMLPTADLTGDVERF